MGFREVQFAVVLSELYCAIVPMSSPGPGRPGPAGFTFADREALATPVHVPKACATSGLYQLIVYRHGEMDEHIVNLIAPIMDSFTVYHCCPAKAGCADSK